MKYKNIGNFPKSFYGIEIKPNEIKEFPGRVSSQNIIEVQEDEEKLEKQSTSSTTKTHRGRKPSTSQPPLISSEVKTTDSDVSVDVEKPKEKV